ncbi:MAG: S41 family peptidase [Acidobacteria bacterium]|nr:S41 family peptidase [Acidobacteriota bacterium]
MQAKARGFVLAIGVIALSAVLGGVYGPSVRATAGGVSDVQDAMKQFTHVVSIVQQNYADPVDMDRAIYNGAIPGMLRVLDPHSSFFDSRQFNLMQEDQRGKYYGVGMVVAPRDGRTVVMAPFVGSPAYRAGIRPGDIILKVDDKPTQGLNNGEVADMLKGPKGTIVHITIGREGADDPLNFTITRDEIPRHGVDNAMLVRPGVGYVRVTQFNEITDRELADALQNLDASRLDGLILDLRGNPGGLLNEGVAVADMFLDRRQLIVSHHGRSSPERRYSAQRGNGGVNVPLVVLMNGNSASASEIVAGAIQDHDRGLIVGEQSFGKGLVQSVYRLSENSGLALTTARYYTPSGRLIQRDYKSISYFDYVYGRKGVAQQTSDVRQTDSGRQVKGGGGITPDEIIPAPQLSAFQQTLMRRTVFWPFELGVGGFTRYYLAQHPDIKKDFVADAAVISEFRKYLDKEKVRYSEADIQVNMDWIKRRIKRDLFVSVFGLEEGYKVSLEDDIQMQKAIDLIPQARALYEKARKIVAQRSSGDSSLKP